MIESYRDHINKQANDLISLRDYIIILQSRLMESQLDVPELPHGIDLSQVGRPEFGFTANAGITGLPGTVPTGASPQQGPHHSTVNDDMNSLNRIAVAGLGMRKHPDETNFVGNNFQQNKRMRPEDNQGESSEVPKQESTGAHPHGLPLP